MWEIFSQKIVIFPIFPIFYSKFLENYITDFQTENSFELSKARTFEWDTTLVPTIKFNFPALWLVEIFWHFVLLKIFLNIDMKLLYILVFAEKITLPSNPLTWSSKFITGSRTLEQGCIHFYNQNSWKISLTPKNFFIERRFS